MPGQSQGIRGAYVLGISIEHWGTKPKSPVHTAVAKLPSFFATGVGFKKGGRAIFVLALMVGWGGLGTGCAAYGRRLLLPNLEQGKPHSILHPDPSYEVVPLRTADGTKIFGQFGRTTNARVQPGEDSARGQPTVIFLYGSSQHLTAPHNQRVFRELRSMGVNVFCPEYPGVGMSEGSRSEQQHYAAADAALDYLLSREDIDRTRIIVAGQSLGSGPAVDLASRRRVAGLVLVGGFTTASDVASGLRWMPRWLANSLTVECRFDNLAKIKSVACPILLVYGTQDTLIPPWMAESLAAAAKSPVTKLPVQSPHNSLWKSPYHGLNGTVREWMHERR